MVSDVLCEALIQINEYLDEEPCIYEGEAWKKIDTLAKHMNRVMAFLDTPPGTEREIERQNNA